MSPYDQFIERGYKMIAKARAKLTREEKKMEAGKRNKYHQALQEFNDTLRTTTSK